jgi:hypothetical protein
MIIGIIGAGLIGNRVHGAITPHCRSFVTHKVHCSARCSSEVRDHWVCALSKGVFHSTSAANGALLEPSCG